MTHAAECGHLVPAGSIVLRSESVSAAMWFPKRGMTWLVIGGGGFALLMVLVVVRMRSGGGGGGFTIPSYRESLHLVPIGQFALFPMLVIAGRSRWLVIIPEPDLRVFPA